MQRFDAARKTAAEHTSIPQRVCPQRSGSLPDVRSVAGNLAIQRSLRTPGQPLDDSTRSFMENRFGHDFSAVAGLNPGVSSGGEGPQVPAEPRQPESLGDVELDIGTLTLADQRERTQRWERNSGDVTFLTVPVGATGVILDVVGDAGARAGFTARFGPAVIRDIRIGMSYEEAARSTFAGFAGSLLGGWAGAFGGALAAGSFRGVGELEVPVYIGLDFGIEGRLRAAATLLKIVDLATLAAGLRATLNTSVELGFGGPIRLSYEDRHLRFNFDQSLDANFNLAFLLRAFISAKLLGVRWDRTWNLMNRNINLPWSVGERMSARFDNGLAGEGLQDSFQPLRIPDLPLADIVRQLLNLSETVETLASDKWKDGDRRRRRDEKRPQQPPPDFDSGAEPEEEPTENRQSETTGDCYTRNKGAHERAQDCPAVSPSKEDRVLTWARLQPECYSMSGVDICRLGRCKKMGRRIDVVDDCGGYPGFSWHCDLEKRKPNPKRPGQMHWKTVLVASLFQCICCENEEREGSHYSANVHESSGNENQSED
jgi:hypothetical protein